MFEMNMVRLVDALGNQVRLPTLPTETKSRVERLKAKVEALLTEMTVRNQVRL